MGDEWAVAPERTFRGWSGHGVGDWMFETVMVSEGPVATFAFAMLIAGYPYDHPFLRGLLFIPAALWLFVGWAMTYMAFEMPFGETRIDDKERS